MLIVRNKEGIEITRLCYWFNADTFDESIVSNAKKVSQGPALFNFGGITYYATNDIYDGTDGYDLLDIFMGRARLFKEVTRENTREDEWSEFLEKHGLSNVKRIDRIYEIGSGKDKFFMIDHKDIDFELGQIDFFESDLDYIDFDEEE